MFFGTYHHSVDAKGRISIPAQYRDELLGTNASIVLARNTVLGERCLEMYPDVEWQELLRKFAQLPRFTVAAQRFQMGYLARSHPCEIDAVGRILVPPTLRQYAELKKEVVLLGSGVFFRLMDREKWMKVEDELEVEAGVNPAMYEDSGL